MLLKFCSEHEITLRFRKNKDSKIYILKFDNGNGHVTVDVPFKKIKDPSLEGEIVKILKKELRIK